MTSRRLIGLVAVAATATALGACSPANSGAGADGKSTYTIGLVLPQGDKYFQGIQDGLKAAAKADGNEIVVVNTNNDASTEASQVQNLIQRKVNAIVMQPATSSAGSVATMKSVTAAHIPLICFGNCTDQAADPSIVKGVAQSDNTALGTGTGDVAAKYIKAKLGGKAVVGMLNCDSFEVCKLRKAGFKDALAKAGVQVQYVADQEGFLPDKATPIATNMLSANPNINLMWSANEGGTIGIVTAVKNSRKSIPVFGTDISDELARHLQDSNNILQATTGQDAQGTAEKAYAQVIKAIKGEANSPLELLVPGITFDRANPDGISKYLAG
ncbi:substrate-binding domain-containing protein [Nonomuraea sp. NPDC000554]|uniref:substrate-binding domain-containing protein n=1 Tax=Nonomuraea sp. NPDC000554 TaxID=3154259 RepID=UPI0033325E5C